MKTVSLVAALVLISTSVMAQPRIVLDPERPITTIVQQGQAQQQGQIQGQALVNQPNQTINVTVPGQSAPSAVVTVSQPPVVVQEAQKAVPLTLPYLSQPNPPYIQPPTTETEGGAMRGGPMSYTPRTMGSKASLWSDGVEYDYGDIEGTPISSVEIRGVPIKRASKNPAYNVPKAPRAANTLTVKKKGGTGAYGALSGQAGEVIWTGTIRAKEPGMVYPELELAALQHAKSIGGSGINELDRHFYAKSTQKGWAPQAGLLSSIAGSVFGAAALFGPSLGLTYQSYVGDTEVYYYIDYEVLR